MSSVVLRPLKGGVLIPIDKPIVLIGRDSACDVVLRRTRRVSRKHCCIVRADDRFYVRDLGSLNGVWVNGERIERERELKLGDHVRIGDVEYRFEQQQVRPGRAVRSAEPVRPSEVSPQELSQDVPVPLVEPDSPSTRSDTEQNA